MALAIDWAGVAQQVVAHAGEVVAAVSEVVEEAARHFEPERLAALIALLVTINAWNRIGVTTRCWEPGSYQPGD